MTLNILSTLKLSSLCLCASLLVDSQVLAQIEDATISELVEQLSSDEVDTRRDAAYELVRRRDTSTQVIEAFANAVDDRDDQVQFQALLGLARAGKSSAPAIDALLAQLRDRSPQIRYRASDALGKIGLAAVDALVAKWSDASTTERVGLADALTQIANGVDSGTPWDLDPAFLMQGVDDSDETLQSSASEAIVAIASASSQIDITATLIRLAEHKHEAVRLVAVKSMLDSKQINSELVQQLEKALQDSSAQIREAAVLATSKLDLAPTSKQQLIAEAITDEVYMVRAAAIAVIGKAGLLSEDFGTELLTSMRQSEDREILNSFLAAFERIGPAAAPLMPQLVDIATDKNLPPERSAQTIASFGKDSIVELIQLLESRPEIEPIASRCLILAGDSAREALIAGLNSQLPVVRASCVSALGTVNPIDDQLFGTLIERQEDSEPEVRAALLTALANANHSGALSPQALSQLASIGQASSDDDSEAVRVAAAANMFLLKLDSASKTSMLAKLLKDESARVREGLLNALAEEVETLSSNLSAVTNSTKDPQPSVRAAAYHCLGQLEQEQVDETIASTIQQGLTDESMEVRARATETLTELESITDEAVQIIANNLADDADLTLASLAALKLAGEKADEFAPSVANLIQHELESLRLAAIETLPEIQSDEDALVGQLSDALQDSAWEVRRSAAVALGKLGKRSMSAVPALMKMISNPDDEDFATSTIRTIDAAPDDSVDLLIDYIDSKDDRTRQYAVFLLGKLGSVAEKALPKLESLLKDDKRISSRDRRYLQRAIESIRNPQEG